MRVELRWMVAALALSASLGLAACGGGGGEEEDEDGGADIALVEPGKTYLSGGGLIPLDTTGYTVSGTPSAEIGGKPAPLIEFGGYYWVMLPALDSGRQTLTLRDASGSWSTKVDVGKPAAPADPLAYLQQSFADAQAQIDALRADTADTTQRDYYGALSARLADARAGLPALSAADLQAMAAFLVANPDFAATLGKASSYDARCESAMKLFVANVIAQVSFVGAAGAGFAAYAVNFVSTTAGKFLAELSYSLFAVHNAKKSDNVVQNIIDACIDENQFAIEPSAESSSQRTRPAAKAAGDGDTVLSFRAGGSEAMLGFNTVPSDLRSRLLGLVSSVSSMIGTLRAKAAELIGKAMPVSLAGIPQEPRVPATASAYRLGSISNPDIVGTFTPGSGNAVSLKFDYVAGKGADQPVDFTFSVIRSANGVTAGTYNARLGPRIVAESDHYGSGFWQGAGVYGCYLYYAHGNFAADYESAPPEGQPRGVTLHFDGVARREALDTPECADYPTESWGVAQTFAGTATGNNREFTVEGGDLLGLGWPTTAHGYLLSADHLSGDLAFHPTNGGESRGGNFDAAAE
jgi:hypothetical protein